MPQRRLPVWEDKFRVFVLSSNIFQFKRVFNHFLSLPRVSRTKNQVTRMNLRMLCCKERHNLIPHHGIWTISGSKMSWQKKQRQFPMEKGRHITSWITQLGHLKIKHLIHCGSLFFHIRLGKILEISHLSNLTQHQAPRYG